MINLNIKKSLGTANSSIQLDIQLDIEEGQLVTLYGESGSGKTSTLRMLSGLLLPDEGQIIVAGKSWFDSKSKANLAPGRRKIGYVFQDYALFPNMSVKENLTFALADKSDREIVRELIQTMDLEELQERKPDSLSGGQKQRVALARALVTKPRILLLDEPLSALDNKMRYKLQQYVLKIHQKYRLTTVLVSHDIGEILKLSDKVFELKEGQVIREGSPKQLFGLGSTSAKFQFTGEVVEIHMEQVIGILTLMIGNDMVKVVCDISDLQQLKVGDKVLVGSKAFNPIIRKL
ncbi:sulfate/molybdate ABC transporter ATP-binding protein [Echinicola sediminis]